MKKVVALFALVGFVFVQLPTGVSYASEVDSRGGGSPVKHKTSSECRKEGKEQGYKGKELSMYVKSCMGR